MKVIMVEFTHLFCTMVLTRVYTSKFLGANKFKFFRN